MNLARTTTLPGMEVSASRPPSLLETICHLREQTGDGLEDDELSFLIRKRNLPSEAGFSFLCLHDGCVTLAVPEQDENAWHPAPRGFISLQKESVAAGVAKKHQLALYEPPDLPSATFAPRASEAHHHIQLADRTETLVIAHPAFLKVRLYSSKTKLPIPLSPDLLDDLSALYWRA